MSFLKVVKNAHLLRSHSSCWRCLASQQRVLSSSSGGDGGPSDADDNNGNQPSAQNIADKRLGQKGADVMQKKAEGKKDILKDLMTKLKSIDNKAAGDIEQTLASKLQQIKAMPGKAPAPQKRAGSERPEPRYYVYVRHLPGDVDRLALLKHFPTAKLVRIEPLRTDDQTTRQALLDFATPEAAQQCVADKQGSQLNGHSIQVRPQVANRDPYTLKLQGISKTTTVNAIFAEFPTAIDVYIPRSLNRNLGLALVEFWDEDEVGRELEKRTTLPLDGATVTLQRRNQASHAQRDASSIFSMVVLNMDKSKSVFACTMMIKEQFPTATKVHVLSDRNTGESRGSAILEFESKEELEEILSKKTLEVDGLVMYLREYQRASRDPSLPRYESIELFTGKRLNAFAAVEESSIKAEKTPETMYELLEKRAWQRLAAAPPLSGWDEDIRLTEQGKLWEFPVTNEQEMTDEHAVSFLDHVFLDEEIETFPNIPSIRHFMELVCVGLSRNAHMTVAEKRAHIAWFRAYFSDKLEYFDDVYADDDVSKDVTPTTTPPPPPPPAANGSRETAV